MRLLTLATAVFALLPLAAAAQRAADAPTEMPRLVLLDDLLDHGGKATETRVLPVWTSSDGRLLTTVALNGDVSLTPPSPQITSALDWRLVNASALLRSDLRLGDSQHLRAGVALSEQSWQAASLQASCFGVPTWLAAASCNDGSLDLARLHGGELSAGWSNGALSFDVAYSLSWLDRGREGLSLAAGAIGSTVLPLFTAGSALPTLVLPTRSDSFGSSELLGARGRWELGANAGIGVGASVGRIRLLPDAEGNRGSYNQTALSLGLDRGAFSGNITGRLLNPQQPIAGALPRWSSIDLGVTWRTPWQGELSIGAQNLWTTPPTADDKTDAQARVPYVQYHQDL